MNAAMVKCLRCPMEGPLEHLSNGLCPVCFDAQQGELRIEIEALRKHLVARETEWQRREAELLQQIQSLRGSAIKFLDDIKEILGE